MERNSLLERRYSFNTSQIQPMAESTCLNSNGNTSRANGTFRWGIPSLNTKCQNNKNLNGTIALDEKKDKYSRGRLRMYSKSNSTKIEPRIYMDVQSRGLSSRIVKYHENGTRLNRSISAYNLHGKPGQFPIVHLKQTPLPMRAIKHTLSITHIPPPEKLTFQGNTLSSLLRSTSVLGLHKTDEDLSHENRPILHPPPTKDDLAPTRSVLDVLKEISRKRINSEDSSNTEITTNFKRQRDININDYASTTPPLTTVTTTGTTSAGTLDTQNAQPQSPEQPKKKRICNYSNNDITSSLSSSMKRKLNDQKQQLNQTKQLSSISSTSCDGSNTIIRQRSKMVKQHSPTNHEKVLHVCKPAIPITPIPDTPQEPVQLSSASSDMTDMIRLLPQQKIFDNVNTQRGFTEQVSGEKVDNTNSNSSSSNTDNNNYNNSAARLTLFNKNYDVTTAYDSNGNDGLHDSAKNNTSNGTDIQFVKPRRYTSLPNMNNPLLKKNQNSKLALMLQSLKDDLYGDEEEEPTDELDSLAGNIIKSNTANIMRSQPTDINCNPIVPSFTSSVPCLVTTTITTPITTSTTNTTEIKANKTSPLVGLKLDKTNSGLNVSANEVAPSSGFSFQPATSTVTVTTSSKCNMTAPTFSFGLATKLSQSTTTTTIQTTTSPLIATTPTTIISPLTSTSSSKSILNSNSIVTTTTTIATTTSNFTFGLVKEKENSSDVTVGTSTNLITFDSFVASTTVTATTTTATDNQTSISMTRPFSFPSASNMNKPNQNVTSDTMKATTNATSANSFAFTSTASTAMPAMTFSQLGQTSNLLPKTAATTVTSATTSSVNGSSSGDFSFNSPIRNTIQNNNNSSSSNIDKPATTASPFSFGGAFEKSNNASKTFSFGVTGSAASIAPPTISNNPTTVNAFSFGNGNGNAMATAKTTTVAATSAATSIMQAPSTFNTFAGMVKKTSTSIFDSAAQPTFNSINGLGTATTATTTTTNKQTNVITNFFGGNSNNAVTTVTTTATVTVAATSANTFTSSNSIFGTTAQISGAASAQDARKGFSFGSSVTNNNSPTTFGNLSQQSTIGNGIAATTATASTSNNISTNIFATKSMGSAAAFNQNKPFTFGSNSFTMSSSSSSSSNNNNNNNNNNSNNNNNNNQNNQNNPNGNLFKDAVNGALNANQSHGGGDSAIGGGGFAFGSTSLVKPLTATSSAPLAKGFSFTNNNNNNNSNSAIQQNAANTFTFGASSIPTKICNGGIGNIGGRGGDGGSGTSTINKPFTFGSSIATATKGSGLQIPNVFGASAASTPTPAFNFGGGSGSGAVAGAAVGAVSAPNIFATNLTNSPTSGERPIRRATRRLQK